MHFGCILVHADSSGLAVVPCPELFDRLLHCTAGALVLSGVQQPTASSYRAVWWVVGALLPACIASWLPEPCKGMTSQSVCCSGLTITYNWLPFVSVVELAPFTMGVNFAMLLRV